MPMLKDASQADSGKGNRRWQFGIGSLLLLILICAVLLALFRVYGPSAIVVAAALFICGILRLNAKLILLGVVVMLGPLAWLSFGALWYAHHHCGEASRDRKAPKRTENTATP